MAHRTKTDTRRLHDLNSEFTRRYKAGDLLQGIDARTGLGQKLRDMRLDLAEHVGGAPTLPQSLLIDEAVYLAVVTGMLKKHHIRKAKAGELEIPTPRYTALYSTWHRMLRDCLKELGFRKPEAKGIDLQAYLRGKESGG